MSTTTNLGLFKHDNPATNTNAFDVKGALNDNWDKIDENAGDVSQSLQQQATTISNINSTLTTNLNAEISNRQTAVANLQTQLNAVASGSPAGVYSTVSALTTADPDHSKIYVVTADGHWYYYGNSQWNDGGTYQAEEIADNSVEYSKLSEEILNSIVIQKDLFIGFYNDLINSSNYSIGTQTTNGYYNITRNKPVPFNGYVTKIYIKVNNEGHKGLLKLSRLSYVNNVLSVVKQDNNEYEISYGNNEIKLNKPVYIEKGEYLGFTITPTTTYPAGYCNISAVYPSTDYEYGLLCTQYSNNQTLKLNNMFPCFDFDIQSENYFTEDKKNWFYGKKWIAYGDSITAGYGLPNHSNHELSDDNNLVNTYIKVVAERNNMEFHNYGTSGRGYSNGDVENYKAYKLIENAHLDNIDIVTIAFGTNDWGTLTEQSNVDFGNVSDSASGTSFCSYVKKAFDNLSTYYPNSIIIVMTPIPRPNLQNNNVAGHNLVDYSEAIKTIAKYYGFYVMDCLSIARSNITNSNWRNLYMLDSVHMTESYHRKFYAPMVEEQMKLAHID